MVRVCCLRQSSRRRILTRPCSQSATSAWSVEFHGPGAQRIVLEQPPSVCVCVGGEDRGCSIQLVSESCMVLTSCLGPSIEETEGKRESFVQGRSTRINQLFLSLGCPSCGDWGWSQEPCNSAQALTAEETQTKGKGNCCVPKQL